jgi:GH18 family chitinase
MISSIEVLYAKTLNLGGAMVWSLDQDDYTGLFCRQGPFPFTRRIHDILFSSDKYNEQEFSSPTRATKLRTKPKISFVPIQRLTSQRQELTLTSTPSLSKSRNVNKSVKNSSNLCLLAIVLSFLI